MYSLNDGVLVPCVPRPASTLAASKTFTCKPCGFRFGDHRKCAARIAGSRIACWALSQANDLAVVLGYEDHDRPRLSTYNPCEGSTTWSRQRCCA